jgi:putative ABC transport system ATP-binding protein
VPGIERRARSGTEHEAMNAERPRVILERVSKTYQIGEISVVALAEITLEVLAGEVVVFLGPSGSGKTTLLNVIGGLDSPSSGRIEVNGLEITQLSENQLTKFRRAQVGFIFQFFNLIPTLTAKENVELAAELAGRPLSPEEILREVGLGDRIDHFPSHLSGGENQRVAIARALAADPLVLLCDEPTVSLDFDTGKRIFKLLRVLNQKKLKTVLVVTHNSAVGEIADRIVRLRDGRIVESVRNPHPMDADDLRW